MIRSRLEKLARVKKRQRLEDSSINQTSSSHQGNLENNENQVNVSSESDNADSDSEFVFIVFISSLFLFTGSFLLIFVDSSLLIFYVYI
ncbi:unnamed protein product [Meloidogyne enterolobii]|uniref:Uncharacterized protein n=1 Tax=Meloidogyne enterolobii TaxID=390850 RepID=A0ACB0ZZD0_MELEN